MPVAPFTPFAILAVLIIGIAAVVLVDRLSTPRLSGRNGLTEANETRAPISSMLARMAEREVIGQLTAAHMIRRRFQIS